MAQSYFPFDSGAGANVTEDQWAKMGALWLPSGVVRGALAGDLAVRLGTGMQVIVAPGRAWHNGFFYENDSDLTLAVDAADATQSRSDLVVIRLDRVANTAQAMIVKGVVGGTLPAPANTATVKDIPLASLAIAANATAPTLFNRRLMVAPPGGLRTYKKYEDIQTGITGVIDLTGLTCEQIYVPAGRLLRLMGSVRLQSSVDNDYGVVQIVDTLGTVHAAAQKRLGTSTQTLSPYAIVALAAGVYTFKAQAMRSAGTGTLQTNHGIGNPATITVEDVGPA